MLALFGCATDSQTAGKSAAAVQPDVFRDGNKPTQPYKEIQILQDEGKAIEQVEIEAKMLKKAKALGGTAVIFHPREEAGIEMSGLLGVTKTFLYKASVVVYTQ